MNRQGLIVHSVFCATFVLPSGWFGAGQVSADPPAFGGFQTNAPANEVTQFKGKLKGVRGNVLAVTREDGTDVMVQPPDDLASFAFVATAKPAFLQRGNLVRFSGTFGPTGIPVTPIAKVEVFQPVPHARLQGHARERFLPGIHPADRRAPKQPVAMAKYNVVGSLMGINAAGVMMVQAGKQPMQVQLAKDVNFELRFNNLNLAKEGDAVTVAGFYQPPDDTKVKAERITITTDRVYGEATEAEPPKRRTRGRRDADKADAEKEAAQVENAEKPAEDGAAGKPAE